MQVGRLFAGGALWAARAERATGLFERMRGLLGRRALGPGAALVIERCGAVHTVGMRFAIDLIFLSKEWRVVRVVRGVPPGRWMVRGGWCAVRVVEAEAGSLDLSGMSEGTQLAWEPCAPVPQRGAT